MYCTACGEQLHEKAIICPKCGVATSNYDKDAQLGRTHIGWFYAAAIFMPMIGLILGVYAIFKTKFLHGAAIVMLSLIVWAFWIAIVTGESTPL